MENARTQIVATLGPASFDVSVMRQLVDAGVDIFRVNLSHGDRETHRQTIRDAKGTGVRVMIDLCGPKLRIQNAVPSFPVNVKEGDQVCFASAESRLKKNIPGFVLPEGIKYERANTGSRVLVDDGNFEFIIRETGSDYVIAESLSEGEIKPRKGVAFSEDLTSFPPLMDDDRTALDELASEPFDMISASFVKGPETIHNIRKEIGKHDLEAPIIAKIEDPAGVKNAAEILKAADGIMVARGDLGICTPIAALPILQKHLIVLANYHRKMVIVATQMLESMTEHTRPTRAEVTDVANAVLDGADAVMLSGETAVGRHPVLVVKTMADIVASAEQAFLTGLKGIL